MRYQSLFVVAVLAVLAVTASAARADLQSYIARPEPCCTWSETSRTAQGGCEIRVFKLISQEWQGIKWEHDLVIYHPVDTPFAGKVFLLNNGGKAREKDYVYDTPEENRMWKWVDPFTYKEKYTMPKLIVLGTNDPYWSTDALNLYWDGLPSQKWISYTANAGHNLVAHGDQKGPWRALGNVAAFVRHQITGEAIPAVNWKHDNTANGKLRLTVTASPAPKKIQLWQTNHSDTDFRTATWTSREVPVTNGGSEIPVEKPATGCTAYFADAGYEIDGIPYTLCTQMRVVKEK